MANKRPKHQPIVYKASPAAPSVYKASSAAPSYPSFDELNEDSKLFTEEVVAQERPRAGGEFPHLMICKPKFLINRVEYKSYNKFSKKLSANIFIEKGDELMDIANGALFKSGHPNSTEKSILYVLPIEEDDHSLAHIHVLSDSWDQEKKFHITVFHQSIKSDFNKRYGKNPSKMHSVVYEYTSRRSVWYHLEWNSTTRQLDARHDGNTSWLHFADTISNMYKDAFLRYLNVNNFRSRSKQLGGGRFGGGPPAANLKPLLRHSLDHVIQMRRKYRLKMGDTAPTHATPSLLSFRNIKTDINQTFVHPVDFLPPIHKYWVTSMMGNSVDEVALENTDFVGPQKHQLARYLYDASNSDEIIIALPLFDADDGLKGFSHLNIQQTKWESISEFSVYIGIPEMSSNGKTLQDFQIVQTFIVVWKKENESYGFELLNYKSDPCSGKVKSYAENMASRFIAYLNELSISQNRFISAKRN